VPIQAIVGGAELGFENAKLFVMNGATPGKSTKSNWGLFSTTKMVEGEGRAHQGGGSGGTEPEG